MSYIFVKEHPKFCHTLFIFTCLIWRWCFFLFSNMYCSFFASIFSTIPFKYDNDLKGPFYKSSENIKKLNLFSSSYPLYNYLQSFKIHGSLTKTCVTKLIFVSLHMKLISLFSIRFEWCTCNCCDMCTCCARSQNCPSNATPTSRVAV